MIFLPVFPILLTYALGCSIMRERVCVSVREKERPSVSQCLHAHMLLVLNMSFLVYIYLFCHYLPYFLRQVSYSTWRSDSGRLAGHRAPGITCLGLPNSTPRTGIVNTHCCSWLSHGVFILAQPGPSPVGNLPSLKVQVLNFFIKTTFWKTINGWQKY